MKSLSKVVWSEGMHLAQHHFQAQSSYFEGLTNFLVSNLFFGTYGLTSYELSTEALLNGTVALTHARGVMPDGLTFQFPGDLLPEPLEIRERFSPTQDSHLVLLAIPSYRPGRANAILEPDGNRDGVRYLAATENMPDETTGQDTTPVAVAQKNFRLVMDSDPQEGLDTLPIARVRRDGSGHFIYDPDYIPPCLQIGASPRIMDLLARLGEMLESRAEAMAVERQGAGDAAAGPAGGEVASFWLSHAIHSAAAPLRHQLRTRSSHPEQLFTELSRLAGALCTFSLDSAPDSLPLYDHLQLDQCFSALDRHIRSHLDIVIPKNCVRIALQADEQHFYTGDIVDRRALGTSHWFLGVRSSASQANVIAGVPRLVKVASAKHIVMLVQRAFPGMLLEHVVSPPAEISPRMGTQYFAIQKSGPVWDAIVNTEQVGVYVPANIPDVELELLVVLGT